MSEKLCGCDECQIIPDMVLPPQFNCMACSKILNEKIKSLEYSLALAEAEVINRGENFNRVKGRLDEAVDVIGKIKKLEICDYENPLKYQTAVRNMISIYGSEYKYIKLSN